MYKYKDYNFDKLNALREQFKPTFIELLPNLSTTSFYYHFNKYRCGIMNNEGNKETLTEEIDRFKNYLINLYEIKQYY